MTAKRSQAETNMDMEADCMGESRSATNLNVHRSRVGLVIAVVSGQI